MILVPTPMNCHPSDHNSCSCRPYEWPFWFGFLVPFVIIYIFNWIMFAIIMISLCRHSVKTPGDKDKKSMVARYLFIAMMLSLLFGLGWAFGLIGTSSLPAGVSIPAQYIFSIFIGFQGVLLFVLHAIRSPDSREEWKRGWYTITGRADKYRVIRTSSIIGTGTTSRSKPPVSENIYVTTASGAGPSEPFQLATGAEMEKIPLSPSEEKSGEPLTVETSITVGDTVIKNTETDEETKGTPFSPSATNPFTVEVTEEKIDDTTTKL